MSKKTLGGTCPLCGADLEEGPVFLVCPSGDYKADPEVWESRWKQFDAAVGERTDSNKRMGEAESLLRDLRRMNIKESR